MDFKFIKTEDNQFIWTDEVRYKIVYKNPSIETFDEYAQIRNPKNILNYYYDLEIYKKDKFNTTSEWKLFNSINTFDFPTILGLQNIIEELYFFEDIKENSYQYDLRKGKMFVQTFDISNGLSEDSYELIKMYRSDVDKVYYNFSIGVRDELLKIRNLSEYDIISLYSCVSRFITYSIETHNSALAYCNELAFKRHKTIDGKLYEYEIDYENRKVTEHIKKIFSVGDKLDKIYFLFNGNSSKNTTELYKPTILKIADDYIKVVYRDIKVYKDRIICVPINKIVYIS